MSGEKKWFIDLQHSFGTVEPEWYAGQCPFIINEKDGGESVIVAPAAPDVLMFSLDCETGKERWRTPNPFGWTMTHASVIPMKLDDGRQTSVYFGKGGAAGIDANNGNILWSTEDWRIEIATCPSPVPLPDNRIFCCGGYLSGSVMLQIGVDSAGKCSAKTLFRLKDAVFGSEQQTPVCYNGHIFGIRQRDKEFVCLSADGKLIWHSGSKGRFGSGPYILIENDGDKNKKPFFLILDDDGKLTACAASVEKYTPLFEVEVLEGHACWSPMAMAAGYLLVRSQDTMACLDMKE
jgi:outer membrane protein assembly factor BamB